MRPLRRSNQRNVYAFIDSQNLNIGIQKQGWKLDWRKFRKYLGDNYGVTKAFLFIGYMPENVPMYEQLHDLGYLIVLKPTQDMTRPVKEDNPEQPEDKKPIKGNIDAELVLWAMKELNNYQQAVIVSGDGDFYCLVEYLESVNKLKKLLVPNRYFSSLFNKYKDYVVRLDKLQRNLSYHKH